MGQGGGDGVPWLASMCLVGEPGERVGEGRSESSHSLGIAWWFFFFFFLMLDHKYFTN